MNSQADDALAAAVSGALPGREQPEARFDIDELAARTDVPLALLEVLEREGFLVPHRAEGGARYTSADVEALAAGVALLEFGVPLGELLELARRYDEAMRTIADDAVEIFLRFVRDPIQGSTASQGEASERLVTAFRDMLPATGTVVAHHFRRLLLASAQARIERDGDASEIAVARSEGARALDGLA